MRETRLNSLDCLLFNLMWVVDHVFGSSVEGTTVSSDKRLFQDGRQQVRHRVGEQLAAQHITHHIPINKLDALSIPEFRKKHQSPHIPVVLTGAAKEWTCCQTWSPEFFAERYGDDEVTLLQIATEDLGRPQFEPIGQTISLQELVERLRQGDRDFYWRFSPLMHRHPELQEDFDSTWLQSFREWNAYRGFELFQLFMGCRGTNTALHNAPASNLFVQVYGRKRWLIYAPIYNPIFDPPLTRSPYFFSKFDPEHPDSALFPGCEHMICYETVLDPGDVLYLPPYYWHQVTNLTDSIGVGYRWITLSSMMSASFIQTLLTFMSTNPPVFRNPVSRRNQDPDLVTKVPTLLQG